jgi:hypothetical protein
LILREYICYLQAYDRLPTRCDKQGETAEQQHYENWQRTEKISLRKNNRKMNKFFRTFALY